MDHTIEIQDRFNHSRPSITRDSALMLNVALLHLGFSPMELIPVDPVFSNPVNLTRQGHELQKFTYSTNFLGNFLEAVGQVEMNKIKVDVPARFWVNLTTNIMSRIYLGVRP